MKKLLILLILISGQIASAQNYVWTQKSNFGGGNRYAPVGISVGNKGYAGLGVTITGGGSSVNYNHVDWWEYDPINDSWAQKANFIGAGRNGACGFEANGFAFVGTGWTPSATSSFYKYDPVNNAWSQAATFGGAPRYDCVSFALNNKGYVGLGYSPYFSDLWEYNPVSNTWTQKANFPGGARQVASAFVVNNLAYVGTGDVQFGTYFNDLWKYDPVTNQWTQKSNIPADGRGAGEGFAIGNYGFFGLGTNEVLIYNDFYKYDPLNDTWVAIQDFPPSVRWHAFSFVIGNCAYVGAGATSLFPNAVAVSDFWCLCDVTGINESNITSENISIYPNPASDFITIDFKGKGLFGNINIQLFNMEGKMVLAETIKAASSITVSTRPIAKGKYILTVTNNQRDKIVKKKITIQ